MNILQSVQVLAINFIAKQWQIQICSEKEGFKFVKIVQKLQIIIYLKYNSVKL